MAALPPEVAEWFAGRGWRVRRHQSEMLAASDAGRHARSAVGVPVLPLGAAVEVEAILSVRSA